MITRSIAHVSDLHIGCSARHSEAAERLCEAINASDVDHVVVTGDITEHGLAREFAEFKRIFAKLRIRGKLIAVPGNHDCLQDGVAREIMDGPRVDVIDHEDVSVVRVNTTGWHNRFTIASHGIIDARVLSEVDRVLAKIPFHHLVIVVLHHHLLPLPEEIFFERLAVWLRLPFADELAHGAHFLERIKGRCDLVLHGHRHVSSETIVQHAARTLRVYNAGSSTLLRKFRRFVFRDGRLAGEPVWINA